MSDSRETTAGIDVAYVARLARLHLSDDEISRFQEQLEQVVEYVNKIGQLDLAGVEPTSHACLIENVFRRDEVKPSIDHETVLENAPVQAKDQFKVPRIVE